MTRLFIIVSEVTRGRREAILRIAAEIKDSLGIDSEIIGDEFGVADAEFVAQAVDLKPTEAVPEALRRYSGSLHMRQVSNARKHLEALRRAAALSEPSLVLEDDASPAENYLVLLADALKRPPPRFGEAGGPGVMLLLGLPAQKGRYQRLADSYDITPVCDSYMVDPAAAAAMAVAWMPIRFATNVQFVLAAGMSGVEIFMTQPNAFIDGSKYGLSASTLNTNNPLIFNSSFMESRRVLADPGASAEELGKVGMVLAASPYKNHPDFMHLRAVLERRRGEPKRADVVFATAFRVYTESGSMLGSDSSFMADYIDNFRDIQDGAPKIQDAREGRPSLSAA